jgi:hypothetical protein
MQDLWLYPIEIEAGDDLVRVYDAGTEYVVNLGPGIYYAYQGQFYGLYPSLFDALETALAAQGVFYTFDSATPTESSQFADSGVEITRTSGPADFGILPGTSPTILSALGLDAFGVSGLGVQTVAGKYSRWCCWQEPLHAMRLKRKDMAQTQFANAGHSPAVKQLTRWGSHYFRRMRYGWLAAAHIYREKASLADYAAVGGLAAGDLNNTFEDVWTHGLSKHRHVIIVHDWDASMGLTIPTSSREIVYAGESSAYADKFSEVVEERGALAEYYTVDLMLESHPTESPYRV